MRRSRFTALWFFFSIAWVLSLGGGDCPAQEPAPEPSEDKKLAVFFRKWLDKELEAQPVLATRLGDHRFSNRMDQIDPQTRQALRQGWEATLKDLPRQIAKEKLTTQGRVDFEIFEHNLKRQIWQFDELKMHERDPRIYSELFNDATFLLLTQSTLSKERAAEACLARVKEIPRLVAQARANLSSQASEVMKVHAETAARQNRGAIQYHESGLLELLDPSQRTPEMKEACSKASQALKDYQRFLETDLLPKAVGNWRLGKEKFARKLEYELESDASADQVRQEAEREFARVENEMVVIARQLWPTLFPGRTQLPEDEVNKRKTVSQVLAALGKDHGKVANLVVDAHKTAVNLKEFIARRNILTLPNPDRCLILEMPEFQRGNSVAYLNQAPPLDRDARSVYAIAPPPRDWDARRVESFMEEYNSRMLGILTLHEAYPGHYVQLEYSNRYPSELRRVLYSGVFAEGWAVYIEQVMLDEGYGNGDLGLRLCQLKWYLRAVANALLDHGMHCLDWTDQEALDLLVNRAYQTEGEAVGKIIRAKQSSCQLSTYFVGRMAFHRLRQEIQKEMGESFQLGPYHEQVLGHGSPPVKYLPLLVREGLKLPPKTTPSPR